MVKAQLQHAWTYSRWVLEGLDEDEYFWGPASLCWSVRRRAPGVHGWGTGEYVLEDVWPPPEPLPIPTIGWRVIHLAAWTDIYRHWAFSDDRPTIFDIDVPGNARDGLQWLDDAQRQFISAVDALDEVSVFEPRPAHWGASVPAVQLVTSMLTEHVHHLAEIGVLRDLHRGYARTRPRAHEATPPA